MLGHCDGCGVTVSHCVARSIISSSPTARCHSDTLLGVMRVPRKHFEEDNDDFSEWNGTEYNLTVPGGRGRGHNPLGKIHFLFQHQELSVVHMLALLSYKDRH